MIATADKKKILLLTPPFVQLNTPYPATAYLKGFLNTIGYRSYQADLGIEVILSIFSKKGLTALFEKIKSLTSTFSENSQRIIALQDDYIAVIEPTVRFLQHKNPTLALAIAGRDYLPEAARFATLEDLDWAFGTLGTHDKARHFATLFLEDLGDLITETLDENFGFSRYAERLGRTATHFEPIHAALCAPNSYISDILLTLLEEKISFSQPDVICITIPFPGNVFSAFKIGQYIKSQYPHIQIVMGGGYCNTELRSVSDPRVFQYVDFICLDDGELPLQLLLEHLEGKRAVSQLKRIFAIFSQKSIQNEGVVLYTNTAPEKDIPQRETGTPDYSDLQLADYLSVIEVTNPMHRLWSDGRWNKLTLAHGCYWGKCSFCDISLDYISRYEPVNASILCDRIEEIIAQTGETGFHFVDEAAPPALMRDLSIEIIRRKITVTWWANIRFEKSFTPDLCRLLKSAGCIAVSGGLEVASDRLLALMEKGVTVAQVARVAAAFTDAGIMVHAYLMYGFPTQTTQETVDSLENVRQLFESGVVQSGFWHQFAMTSHSPVGLNPQKYGVVKTGPEFGGFADNDLYHDDPKGADHEAFSAGLKKSLFNFMHGVGFDFPLADWFDFKIPKTSVASGFIENVLSQPSELSARPHQIVVCLSNNFISKKSVIVTKKKKKNDDFSEMIFLSKKELFTLQTGKDTSEWLQNILPKLRLTADNQLFTIQMLQKEFEKTALADFDTFDEFLTSFTWQQLKETGLVLV